MHRSVALIALTLALVPACGSSSKEPATPEGGEPQAAASEPKAADPQAEGTGEQAKPAGGEAAGTKPAEGAAMTAPKESETLARDIVKSSGRRIGWSATKKMFVVPSEMHKGDTHSIDLLFYGEDGKSRDPMRICQMGECEEHLDEILKEMLPKIASKLEDDGYVAIRSIGWPEGRDELEVNSLGMKLRFAKGRVEGVREGKPPVALTVAGGRLDAEALKAVFLVPDTKLVGVFASPAKKTGVEQAFYVLKLP